MRTLLPLAAPLALALLVPAAQAQRAVGAAHGFAPRQLVVKFTGQKVGRALSLAPGAGVQQSVRALRRNPRVVYAEPNYVATASASAPLPFDPDDNGTLVGSTEISEAGNWAIKQWNFLSPEASERETLPTSPGGIDAVDAWRHMIEAGRPGATGVIVAVLDSGIAYRSLGTEFLRSPDFVANQFVPGYDFVGHDKLPLDENGHGTHVAGTIGEKTDNGIGLTGLAYRAKLMPVRVLNRRGRGNAVTVAKGIRFAIEHHAQVINMSFNFACGARVPVVDEALRSAFNSGIVTVASGGNYNPRHPKQTGCVSEPATGPRVIGVGATTEGACIGSYSLAGTAIDVVAPGGGEPRRGCPSILDRPIYQVTLRDETTDEFSIPADYDGTSMAAAHVSGVAALVLASGVLGHQPSPRARVDAVARRLRQTARDLGYPRTLQGAGLIDAARATAVLP